MSLINVRVNRYHNIIIVLKINNLIKMLINWCLMDLQIADIQSDNV